MRAIWSARVSGHARGSGERSEVGGRETESGLSGGHGRVLIRGTEVTDGAARFFVGAGAVEGDQPVENVCIGECGVPAVRGGNGGGEFVMELAQD